MKTIGLLGGMSWESTATYYRLINEGVKQRLGGLHSAQIMLYSVDFGPIETLQHEGDWMATARILAQAARRVEAGGADFLLVCTNTMHRVADAIEGQTGIPLLHIADATAARLRIIGYLIMHTRQLDMVMAHPGAVARYRDTIRRDIESLVDDGEDRSGG